MYLFEFVLSGPVRVSFIWTDLALTCVRRLAVLELSSTAIYRLKMGWKFGQSKQESVLSLSQIHEAFPLLNTY